MIERTTRTDHVLHQPDNLTCYLHPQALPEIRATSTTPPDFFIPPFDAQAFHASIRERPSPLEMHSDNRLDKARSSNCNDRALPSERDWRTDESTRGTNQDSQGIQIPKSVIEQCYLHRAVDLEIQQG